MTATFPAVTAIVAAVLGLLGVLLAVRVIVTRVRLGVNAGDGGHAVLAQAIRAHSNFTEHAPLAVLLLALAETSGAVRWAERPCSATRRTIPRMSASRASACALR